MLNSRSTSVNDPLMKVRLIYLLSLTMRRFSESLFALLVSLCSHHESKVYQIYFLCILKDQRQSLVQNLSIRFPPLAEFLLNQS